MITEQIFYGVRCDRCGDDFESRGDYSYMTEKGDIVDEAVQQGWQEIDHRHYCPDCYEENPDPNHDDDHEYRAKPAFPEYIWKLKMFLKVLGGWRQEVYEDEVCLAYYTESEVKDIEPEHRAMIDRILATADHRIEVRDCKGCLNAEVIIFVRLKRFYVGQRIRVIRHHDYLDCFGKQGVILKEAPPVAKGCYAVQIFDDEDPNPHYLPADWMELVKDVDNEKIEM